MKYSNTAITQLTRLYKSILVKCAIFNAAILMSSAFVVAPAMAEQISADRQFITGDSTVTWTEDSVSNTDYKASVGRPDNIYYGGRVFVDRGSKLTIDSSSYENITFDGNGAAASTRTPKDGKKAVLNVTNTTFTNNHSRENGGAIASYNELSVSGSTFEGNTALLEKDGEGKYTIAVTTGMDDKPMGGGAIGLGAESNSNIIAIETTNFINNKSGLNGGAIATRLAKDANNSAAKLDISATFTGNEALQSGGAIYNTFYTDNGLDKGDGVTVTGAFTNNKAGANGGAIFNDGAKDKANNDGGVMTVYNSTFENNSVTVPSTYSADTYKKQGVGGAIASSGNLTVNNSTFTGNTARTTGTGYGLGGALSTVTVDGLASKMTIEDSTFVGNSADIGGAVYGMLKATNQTGLSDITISESTFDGNSAIAGSAIANFDEMTVSDTTFQNNTTFGEDDGGTVFLGSESVTSFTGGKFEDNTSGTFGGAIATRNMAQGDNSAAKLDISGVEFTGNKATVNGGAIDNYFYNDAAGDGYVKVTDSTFTSNSAGKGGAVYNHKNATQTGKMYFSDSTFTGNTATTAGAAIYNEGIVTLAGTNTFSGNKVGENIDDIDGEGGTINIAGGTTTVSTIKNQTVNVNAGELHLTTTATDGSNLSGSTVTVANDAIINTIDDVVNDYSSKINLADGAKVKGDVDFENGVADKYAATSGTIKYMVANLIGAAANGSKTIQVAGEGSTINISEAKFNIENGLTFESSGSADGKMIVNGMSGGIEDAADASSNVETVDYDFKANESVDNNKEFHHTVTVNGDGISVLTLNADLGTAAGGNTTYNKMNFAGAGALNNAGMLHINDSNVGVDVNNYGTLVSDPTTYTGKVTNAAGALASFDADTFTTTAELANSGDAYLENNVQFQGDAKITGNGDLYLMSGTTVFNNTANSNDAYLASGAKFSGTLVGGSLDTQNGAIDTGLGTIQDADLYMDAKLSGTGSADAFTGTTGSTIKEITILGNDYNPTKDELKIAVGNATLDDDVVINGANYYTKVEKDTEGNLVFSDKLINTSTLRGTDATGETVTIADKAETTNIGTNNAKIALSDSGKTATVTAANGLIVSDGTNNATLTAKTTGLDVAQGLTVGGTAYGINSTGVGKFNGFTVGSTTYGINSTGAASVASLSLAGTAVTSTAVELNQLHGSGVETADLTKLHAVTADAAELNVLDGITASTAELNILDGATVTTAELNVLDGITASTAELNLVDGMTAVDDGTFASTSTTTFATNATVNKAKTDVETKLAAGATGYDINAKTLKVQGNDVLSTANVAPNYTYNPSTSTIADVTTYVSTNGTKFANVASTAGLIETVMSDKEDWIGRELGYDPKTTDANTVLSGEGFTDKDSSGKVSFNDAVVQLKDDITVTAAGNYIVAGENVAANLSNLDTGLHDVATIVGPAQTTAATTGQFAGRKIGDDINVVSAVDELGRNMVSLGANNVFTGSNTFRNDNGITIQDSTPTYTTRLTATADGLNVNTGIKATALKLTHATRYVDDIDVSGAAVNNTAAAQNVMATGATVYEGAENAKYDGTKINGDTSSTTIKTALDTTNTKLNGILTTDGSKVLADKVSASWQSGTATLDNVLGNGAYTSTDQVSATANITTAISQLDDAIGTTTYVSNKAVNYGTIAANTDLTDAVSQVASNIGSAAVTGTNGNVLATNTVNQNLDLIDSKIGNLTSLDTTAKSTVVAAINEVVGDINVASAGNYIAAGTDVAGNLGALDTRAKKNADDIADIKTEIGTYGTIVTKDAAPAFTGSTLADVNAYVTAQGAKVADVATTAGLVTAVLYDKEAWIGDQLGFNPKTTDANTVLGASGAGFTDKDGDGKVSFKDAVVELKDDINVASAGNYIAAGTNVASNLTALDTQVKANADKNTIQDTGMGNLASTMGVTYTAATGAVSATDYAYTNYIADGDSLVTAVGKLDNALKTADANYAKLDGNNVFTGTNEFQAGIKISNGGSNTSILTATADGLNVDTDLVAKV